MIGSRLRHLDRIDLKALFLVIGFLVALLLFGARLHPMESEWGGSPERDFYVLQIDEIMHGALPRDEYHPLLYVLVSSLPAYLLHDPFAGGQLVSYASAALLLSLVYLFGRSLHRSLGLHAMLALMLNSYFLVASVSAATDMLFSALAFAVISLSVKILNSGRRSFVFLLGAVFATSYFTRYTAAFLLPVVVFSIVLGALRQRRTVALHLLLFVLAVVLFLAPHFWLTTHIFGSPLHNESWQNTALRMYADRYVYTPEIQGLNGLWSTVMSNPSLFLWGGAREALLFLNGGAADTVGMGGSGSLLGSVILVGSACGLSTLIRRPDVRWESLVGALFCVVYVSGLCATFYFGPRYVIALMPLVYLSFFHALKTRSCDREIKVGRVAYRLYAVGAGTLLMLLAMSSAYRVYQFSKSHGLAERGAARALEDRYGPRISIVGNSPYLGRYLKCRYSCIRVRKVPGEALDWIALLKETVDREGADFVVVGRASLGEIPVGLLRGVGVPEFLSLEAKDEEVAVYRVRRAALSGLAGP